MRKLRIAVVGAAHSGKTTAVCRIAGALRTRGLAVGGVVQPSSQSGAAVAGYLLEDIATGEQRPFITRDPATSCPVFETQGWLWAAERIRAARRSQDVLVVDELGLVEARGGGHLRVLAEEDAADRTELWLLAVRDVAAGAVQARLGAFDLVVAPSTDASTLCALIDARLGGR